MPADSFLFRVRKEHEYSVSKEAAVPLELGSATTQAENDTPCEVCREKCFRYTCPRCATRYCSLDCYQQHGNTDTGDCKEGFFRDRASQYLDLEVKERLEDTKKLIQRVYEKQTDDNKSETGEETSKDELKKILRSLEEGDEAEIDRIMNSAKFNQALAESLENGELLDYVLESWTPWWRPEILIDQDYVEDEDVELTLDERLGEVPPLTALHPRPCQLPDLLYNLVELLYSTTWTLRLYHGCKNAKESSVDAADTLLKASQVLASDARWESLPEVLSACTMSSTRSLRESNGCNTTWSSLVCDVVLICENPRFIAKALVEAIDILRAATSASKQSKDASTTSSFRKARKKTEFFLSWSRDTATAKALNGLSRRVEVWSGEWKLTDAVDDSPSDIIRLPSAATSASAPRDTTTVSSPIISLTGDNLLSAISTRSKRVSETSGNLTYF